MRRWTLGNSFGDQRLILATGWNTNAPRSSLIVNQLTTMIQTKPDGYDGFVVIMRRCVRLSSIVYSWSRNHPHDRSASRQCKGMTR